MGQSCTSCICKNKTDEYIVSNEKLNSEINVPKIKSNIRSHIESQDAYESSSIVVQKHIRGYFNIN